MVVDTATSGRRDVPAWVRLPPSPMPDGPYRIVCYRQRLGCYPSYRIAKAVLLRHVWTCPWGAMPWARPVKFYCCELPGSDVAFVTAARGEWLNHGVMADAAPSSRGRDNSWEGSG